MHQKVLKSWPVLGHSDQTADKSEALQFSLPFSPHKNVAAFSKDYFIVFYSPVKDSFLYQKFLCFEVADLHHYG